MRTDELTNLQIVCLAVGLLNGQAEQVDAEDIAIKANELAPGRFTWRKHPDRIDLVTVAVALRDAKKPKNGGLLVGSNSRGWMLSPAGLQWLKELQLDDTHRSAEAGRGRRESLSASQEAERSRMRGTRAYRLFVNGDVEAITVRDFYAFARVNEYFQDKTRDRRYALLDNAVVGDEALSALWELLKAKYAGEN